MWRRPPSTPPPPRRWKPWSPARIAKVAAGFAALMGLLVLVNYRFRPKGWLFATWLSPPRGAAEAAEEPEVSPSSEDLPRADARLAREGRSPIAGGLLTIPPAFASQDGVYDLVVHFHGNTDLVEESFVQSRINAVVVILNLGNGSGVYEDRFANVASLPDILGRTQAAIEKRGLRHARRGRLALTAWSAGYGAVLKILEQPSLTRDVDAVVLLDGIHVGYQPPGNELVLARLEPFARFAREAIEDKKLFSITHSEIIPIGNYAGTKETTDALLREVGVARDSGGERAAIPALHAVNGVLPRDKLLALEPRSVVRRGGLRVRGYGGDQPEHHIAHLVQMVNTALPDLRERWGSRPAVP